MSLLLDLELMPKMIERRSTWLLYWKNTAQVEDFLTLIGARHAALAIMEAKVEKQLRGEINRKVNCETANLIKITSASTKQISAIEKALAIGGIEIFPEICARPLTCASPIRPPAWPSLRPSLTRRSPSPV